MLLKVLFSGEWTVYAVCSDRGSCYVEDFLKEASAACDVDSSLIFAIFKRIAKKGIIRNNVNSHSIAKDIYEIIAPPLRISYFYDANKSIILTHGFRKTSQVTPDSHKDRAIKTRNQYFLDRKVDAITYHDGSMENT